MKHCLRIKHLNVLPLLVFIGTFLLLLGKCPLAHSQPGPEMGATRQDPGGGYALVLDLGALQTSWMRASARLELVLRIGGQTISIPKLSLCLENVHILVNTKWTPIQAVAIQAVARIDPHSEKMTLDDIRCFVGSRLVAQGHLEHAPQKGKGMFALNVQAAGQALAPIMPSLSSIQVKESGSACELSMAWKLGDAEQASVLDLELTSSQPVHWQQDSPDLLFRLPPLSLSIKANLSNLNMWWHVQAAEDVQFGSFVVTRPQAKGRIEFLPSGIRIPRADLKSEGVRRFGADEYEQAVHIQAEDLAVGPQGFDVGTARMDIQDLGSLDLSGTWAGPEKNRLTAQGSGLKVAGLVSMLQAVGWELVPGWSFQGNGDIQMNVRKEEKSIQGSWDLAFEGLGGTSPDQQIMAAGLTGTMQGTMHWKSLLQADLALQVNQGEVLWGAKYANLEQAPVSLQGSGSVNSQNRAEVTRGEIQIGQMLHLQCRAGFPLASSHPGWEVEITKSRLQLSDLRFVVQGLLPQDWDPEGLLAWTGTVRGTGHGPLVQGVLQGQGLGLGLAQGQENLDRWEFTLPVEYSMGRVDDRADADKPISWGSLRPGRLAFAGRNVHVGSARIRLTGNALEFGDPLKIRGMGSDFQIGAFMLDLPWNRKWRAEGKLDIVSLRPAEMLNVLPGDVAELSGRLEVVATTQEIKTQGQLQGTVFGGNLLIDELGIKRPLEPSRMVTGNAHISDLSLEILSQSLGIGRITGKVNIDLNRLGLAYGQPVRLHLRAESVPESEVDRRISLQAVNSLSIIGTGQGLSGLGIRLYAGFFKQFPYQKMGVSCVLANDVFSLNGLIKEDGVEYIVKRGWTGINVINTNPNNMIAFSDMLDRLERITTQTEQ